MNAIPGITHNLEIFRKEGDQLIPYHLVLDSRRVVLCETRGEGKAESAPILSSNPQTAYYDKHGYGYTATEQGVLITSAPAIELDLVALLEDSLPVPVRFPQAQGEQIRKLYKEAVDALKASNPECTDCEIGKIKRRFMDMGRTILQNTQHADHQTPHPGN